MEIFDKNKYSVASYVDYYLHLDNKHRLIHTIFKTIIGGGKD